MSLRLTTTALACALACAMPARAETVALQGTVTSGDDARGEFWIGANHSAELLKVEPLD